MSLKLASREWLNLDEAAELSSIWMNESFSKNDMLRFICEGKLKVCWNISLKYLMEVSLRSEFYPGVDFYRYCMPSYGEVNPHIHKTKSYMVLSGLFNLDPNINNIAGILSNANEGYFFYSSTILTDDDGRHFQIVERESLENINRFILSDNEINKIASIEDDRERVSYKKSIKRDFLDRIASDSYIKKDEKVGLVEEYSRKIERIGFGDFKMVKLPEIPFFPSARRPKLSELAIKVKDLRVFADLITGVSDAGKAPPLSGGQTKSNGLTLSTARKIILGMAKTKYNYNPENRRNTATGSNAGSISADLESHGIRISGETIAKYLKPD